MKPALILRKLCMNLPNVIVDEIRKSDNHPKKKHKLQGNLL